MRVQDDQGQAHYEVKSCERNFVITWLIVTSIWLLERRWGILGQKLVVYAPQSERLEAAWAIWGLATDARGDAGHCHHSFIHMVAKSFQFSSYFARAHSFALGVLISISVMLCSPWHREATDIFSANDHFNISIDYRTYGLVDSSVKHDRSV